MLSDLAGPVAVVSPHLDDGVFGCGELLAAHPGSVVVTVFAGRPPRYGGPTAWDAAGGFRPGDDVVGLRRDEDRTALALLGARPIWLAFRDAQYGDPPSVDVVSGALEAAIREVDAPSVFIPLGLFHSDHHLAHEAALGVMRRRHERSWFAYEDAVYRRIPDLLEERLAALRRDGLIAGPPVSSSECGREAKRRAVRCYRSQLRALAAPGYPGYDAAFAAERYWPLAAGVRAAGGTSGGAGRDGD